MADVGEACVKQAEALPSTKAPPKGQETAKPLPKLSMQEFSAYNSMASMMDRFHEHFRQTWNMIYQAASNGKRPMGMSIRSFLNTGIQLTQQITLHHNIEEAHIYPHLAPRMPAFRDDVELLKQHEQIHEGLERLEEYLNGCRLGEQELRMAELKGVMDGFGKVLWDHMDDEVRELGAEEMRKYWSVEEMRRMPF